MSRDGKKDSAELDTSTLPSLPKGWCWVKVGDVGDVKLGRQRSPEHHNGPYMRPYLRVANVYEDRFDLSDVMEMNFTPEEYETYCLQYGDILLNEGQSLEWVGRPAMYRDEVPGVCFQNTLVRFRAKAGVAPAYALYLFRHYLHAQRFQRIAKWTVNIAHLGAQRFAEIEFPLAPSNEQHRIVAKIEELFSDLDAGVAALERVKAKLKRYRAAVLKAAVEGRLTEEWRKTNRPKETGQQLLDRILRERRRKWEEEQLAAFATAGKTPQAKWKEKYKQPAGADTANLPPLPEGWCWASVEQLICYLRNGLSQKPSQTPPGFRILRINAVRPMSVDLKEIRYYDKPESDVTDYFLTDGDLLFTRYNGSVDLLGVAGRVTGITEPTLHPDKLIRVKAVLDEPLPRYLEMAANVGESRRHMQSRARTTAGQTGISGADIREMPIPLPPLGEQAEIISEVQRRLSIIEEAEAQVSADARRSTRLRQSILKRAFEGKLVPQDPANEPARALLERIKHSAASRPGSQVDSIPDERRSRKRPRRISS